MAVNFFTNWSEVTDSISWPVDVVESGNFVVTLHYTCVKRDTGSVIVLSFKDSKITGEVVEAFDPPLRGMENDRVERVESYVKDFKPLPLGVMHLRKGSGMLTLKATSVPGNQVMDLRMVMFKRVDQ